MALESKKNLTTGEVAAFCDVNFRTVIRWIERGLLNAYKLPGRGDHRIPVDELISFMTEHGIPLPDSLLDNGKKIFVVDDEPAMTAAIARVLKRADYEVKTANDGFSAGAIIQSFKPALMTVDLNMPGVNGFDVINYVKSDANLHETRVLVISAEPIQRIRETVRHGADGYLSKPFENEELLQEVRRILAA